MNKDILNWFAALLIIALMFYLPTRFTRRTRVLTGAALFVLGWGGVFLGLSLGDRPFLQVEWVAMTWVGTCGAAILLSITLLVPAFFEWLRARRKPRRKRERWPFR